MIQNNVHSIRNEFARFFVAEDFVGDKTGTQVIEIINASFVADEPYIFGKPNDDYIAKELSWYTSMSLNVNDIPGGPPAIWKQVADRDGFINSNYGWCIFSADNHAQFGNVVNELERNPESRRAIMIYTRPNMWSDFEKNGRSDFMCTNTVQYILRKGVIDAVVNMRSNDAWAGYRNDYAWQKWVLDAVVNEVGVRRAEPIKAGKIHWNVGSLHVYSRQFYLVHHFICTGESHISKEEYELIYKVG